MNPVNKLLVIKCINSLIWLFFVVVIFYILYSGICNDINSKTILDENQLFTILES